MLSDRRDAKGEKVSFLTFSPANNNFRSKMLFKILLFYLTKGKWQLFFSPSLLHNNNYAC